MLKRLLSISLLLSSQAYAESSDTLTHKPAAFKLGFETITLPNDESMGMVGGSYLIETLPGLYLGPAAYGAITGERGGFFTGGGEITYRLPVTQQISVDTGFYLGGGGGGAAGVGGGLMLRPHIDLLWDFGGIRAGISASEVRFPSGNFSSRQLGLMISVDDTFSYSDANRIGQYLSATRRGGVGFDRIAVIAAQSKPQGNSVKTTTGAPTPDSTSYAGFLMTQSLNNGWLWGVEAAGAVKGSSDGYAEVLGTFGWEYAFNSSLRAGTRVALGMGGGGAVDTGGGALGKASVFGTYQITRDLDLTLETGLSKAFDGSFQARFASLQLGMALDHPHASSDILNRIEGWQWDASAQHYTSAARRDGSKRSMQNIGFKLNRKIDDGFYLSGQAHSALGGGAGGYSVGLIGAGWESQEIIGKLRLSAEMLVGAAGGGGVDSDGGAIMQPMAYASYPISNNWQVKAGAGVVKSFKGELNSPVLDLSIGYRFGLPRR
ncbi:MAG: hypothetical protein NT086_13175 [Proteobacteria bacterium]|nr:hypothetical protein [Pseudomonadota bacterium]